MKAGLLLLAAIFFSVQMILSANSARTAAAQSSPSQIFLKVDKTSGEITDTFTFTVSFSSAPDSSDPIRLEYLQLGTGTWQVLGSSSHISDFVLDQNSISEAVVPNSEGMNVEGNYSIRAVHGNPDTYSNSLIIALSVPQQVQAQQVNVSPLLFYAVTGGVIIVAFILVFTLVSRLMNSPTESW